MKLAGAYVDEATYAAMKALAKKNHRSLAGQVRECFERALAGELAVPPGPLAPRRPQQAGLRRAVQRGKGGGAGTGPPGSPEEGPVSFTSAMEVQL